MGVTSSAFFPPPLIYEYKVGLLGGRVFLSSLTRFNRGSCHYAFIIHVHPPTTIIKNFDCSNWCLVALFIHKNSLDHFFELLLNLLR